MSTVNLEILPDPQARSRAVPSGCGRLVSRRRGLRRELAWLPPEAHVSDAEALLEGLFALERTLPPGDRRRRRVLTLHPVERLVPGAGQGTATAVLKHERFPFPSSLFTFGARSSCRREMRGLTIARALGAPAFRPVVAGEVRWGPFFSSAFLATERLEAGCNLSHWLRDPSGKAQRDFPVSEVRAGLPALLEVLADLHRRRFYCGTLYGKNVLLWRDPESRLRFVLHDLPRAAFAPGRRLSVARAAYDLACLDRWGAIWLSRTSRLALFEHYLERLAEGPARRLWLRRIETFGRRVRRESRWRRTTHWTRRHAKLIPWLGDWIR